MMKLRALTILSQWGLYTCVFSVILGVQTVLAAAPAQPSSTLGSMLGSQPSGQLAGGHLAGGQLEITSDWLEVDQQAHVATFGGQVKAIRGDLTLTADKAVVDYVESKQQDAPKQDANKQDNMGIKQIEATGHVVLVRDGQQATADRAVYDPAGAKVELFGQVNIHQLGSDNEVTGTHLVYDLVSGRVTMRADKGRVRAHYRPVAKGAKASK